MKTFDMGRVPPVTFGAGSVAKVPELVAVLGGGSVLVVADAALAAMGLTDRLTQGMVDAGIGFELAAEVAGEPKETLIDDLCAQARAIRARTVIGFGGGAVMDAAKLVAAIAQSELSAVDFALAARDIPAGGLPAIAIPTTAGTGSEVTRTAIISTPNGVKNWFWGDGLAFAHAVLDPELTVSLPPHLTAWTGMDAVAHALEGITARQTSPAGLLYGLEALRILSDALPRVVVDGSNIELRGRVLWASTLAGLTLHNCNTHVGHNISHALGSLAPVHHGLATGLALEVVLPWLVEQKDGHSNYAFAAEALGSPAQADALPQAFADLMRACRIPLQLPDSCADVSPTALAEEMKSAANHVMLQNAACIVSNADVDTLAERMMNLRLVELAT